MSGVGRTESLPASPGKSIQNEVEVDRGLSVEAKSLPADGKKVPDAQPPASNTRDHHPVPAMQRRLERAVAILNEYSRSTQRDLQFSIDSELDRTVVQVIDSSTHEVVRQIPNEVALNLARNLQDNLEQLSLQRAARLAGVDQFAGEQAISGILNTHA